MSLYLFPHYAIVAEIPEDNHAAAAQHATEMTTWLKDPVNGVEQGNLLRVEFVGVNEGDYAYALGVDISRFATCVYEGEKFSDDKLVRPFHDAAWGGDVENLSAVVKNALPALQQQFDHLEGFSWTDEPERFFTVSS